MALLKADKVVKRFGGLVAVKDLDFELAEGSIASVIGPNGAGKTTFFNCLSGFIHIDEGRITFGGKEIHHLRPDNVAHLGISRTYQNIRLFAASTALENILVGQHNHLRSSWMGAILRTPGQRAEEARAHEEAIRLLNLVGLKGRGDALAAKLPYGDQRRLEIARALANKPRLLLLDEPTEGLAPVIVQQIRRTIAQLKARGFTILLVEQNFRFAATVADRHYVVEHGRVIDMVPNSELGANMNKLHEYLGV